MSEPTTEAERALMEAMFGEAWNMPDSPGDAIAAIEREAGAEAARAYKERLTAGVNRLEKHNVWGYDWECSCPAGTTDCPHEVDGDTAVSRAAVLRLIEDTK